MNETQKIQRNIEIACSSVAVAKWQGHARSGNKIEAIKAVRTACGFNLRDAKDTVEFWQVQDKTPTWGLPSAEGETRVVRQNIDGTFTVLITKEVKLSNLGELLQYVTSA